MLVEFSVQPCLGRKVGLVVMRDIISMACASAESRFLASKAKGAGIQPPDGWIGLTISGTKPTCTGNKPNRPTIPSSKTNSLSWVCL